MSRTDTPTGETGTRARETGTPSRDVERTKIRRDFVWHLGTYLIMMAFFAAIAAMAGTGSTWVLWVAIPWGLAVAFHALATVVDGTRVLRPEDEAKPPQEHQLV